MRLRKNKHDNIIPLTPSSSPEAATVIATLENLRELNPAETMLVGSAALALYGIELNPYDPLTRTTSARPKDIDIAATGSHTSDLYQFGVSTPAGVIKGTLRPEDEKPLSERIQHASSRRSDTIIQLIDSSLAMPVDVITQYHDGEDLQHYDRYFRALIAANSQPIESLGGLRIASPAYIHEQLSMRARGGDPKAAQDKKALESQFPTKASRKLSR